MLLEMNKRRGFLLTRLAALLAAASLLAACAPGDGIAATLTLLPGTPTPPPGTPWPTLTPSATNTLPPGVASTSTPTTTPIPPQNCPPFSLDTALPDDPAQLPGRHYDTGRLPDGLTLVASGAINADGLGWVQVRWQNRSLYWIQRLVCRDLAGTPYWEITDALALPRLSQANGEAETRLCYQGDQPVPAVVAYGLYDPATPAAPVAGATRGWPLRVQAAWQMTDHFAPLDVQSLTCVVQERTGGQ